MRKRYVIIGIFWVLIARVVDSNAVELGLSREDSDWYVSFNSPEANQNSQTVKNNTETSSYNFSASLGYKPYLVSKFLDNTRIETEVSFNYSAGALGGAGSKVATVGVMENAFYNFDSGNNAYPYVGIGAGVVKTNAEGMENLDARINGSNILPTYKAMAGVLYKLESHPGATVHMGYKYSATALEPTLGSKDISGKDQFSHNIETGVKVVF